MVEEYPLRAGRGDRGWRTSTGSSGCVKRRESSSSSWPPTTRPADVRRQLDRRSRHLVDRVPHGWRQRRAAVLYERFSPLEDCFVGAGLPADILGSAHHFLMLLAATSRESSASTATPLRLCHDTSRWTPTHGLRRHRSTSQVCLSSGDSTGTPCGPTNCSGPASQRAPKSVCRHWQGEPKPFMKDCLEVREVRATSVPPACNRCSRRRGPRKDKLRFLSGQHRATTRQQGGGHRWWGTTRPPTTGQSEHDSSRAGRFSKRASRSRPPTPSAASSLVWVLGCTRVKRTPTPLTRTPPTWTVTAMPGTATSRSPICTRTRLPTSTSPSTHLDHTDAALGHADSNIADMPHLDHTDAVHIDTSVGHVDGPGPHTDTHTDTPWRYRPHRRSAPRHRTRRHAPRQFHRRTH